MKKIYIILLLLVTTMGLKAQGISYDYEYDAAGNRERRTKIDLKSGEGESLLNATDEINNDLLPLESLEDYLAGHNLKIYPNPTRGEMAIEFVNFPEKEEVHLKLFDNTGRLIINDVVVSRYYLVDINDKPNGNYLLQLTLGQSRKTYQIVKQ